MHERCSIPGCRGEVDLVYLDVGICEGHWNQFTADDAPHDALRRALGIEDAPSATEEPMEEKETETATAEADGQNASAEPPTEENEEMATKTTKRKRTTKKETGRRAASPAKSAKVPKASKAKAGEKPNRVFAIRVTDVELAAIHKAAGPRNATRFVRAVAAAFAAGDDAAFRAVVKEAREQR